jgi:hypothetical protein
MFDKDFHQSQPPVLPPHDVWIASYKDALASEDEQLQPPEAATQSSETHARKQAGKVAGGMVMITSAEYKDITNG